MPRLKPSGCRRPPESSPAAPRGRGASLRTCFLRRLPAALALLLLAALAAPAQAATLVSNIGQSVDETSQIGTEFDFSQGFTTGTGGGALTSIEIKLRAGTAQTHPTVTLHSGSATSAAVATLSAPAGTVGTTTANYTYTAPANTTLAASTTYYVLLEDGGSTVNVRLTSSDNEDSGGATGWSVADSSGWRTASSTGGFTDLNEALMIRVNGTATTPPPVAGVLVSTLGQTDISGLTLGTNDLAFQLLDRQQPRHPEQYRDQDPDHDRHGNADREGVRRVRVERYC